ncbi:MAG: hypothetical protein N2039_12200 [Gemmataceae bacterium]|nr:hypothetical protein [Gemmataceae bacterium]
MVRTIKFAVVIGLAFLPGCGFREREGLLSRLRARLNGPDYVYSAPVTGFPAGYDVGMPVAGLPVAGMPVSMNGSMPCPCSPTPGLPNYPSPEILPPGATPWPQTSPQPVSPPSGQPGQSPGTAPPKPAEPSDSNGNQRTNPLATSKPNGF